MQTLTNILRASAEPTRLRLLALLRVGELTVSELVSILGQSQPRISRHLKLLTDAGILERIQEGSWVFYRLTCHGPAANFINNILPLIPDNDPILTRDQTALRSVKQNKADIAADYFRANATHWHDLRSLHIDEAVVEQNIINAFKNHPPKRLIDIGTGTGRILELMASTIDTGVGIDQSREMLGIARSRIEALGFDHIQVRQGDLFNLNFAAASFDAAVLHQVLHFLDAPDKAIEEAARILNSGGRLMIIDFAPHDLENLRHDHNHHRLGFADDDIKTWCARAGLTLSQTVSLDGASLTVKIWQAVKKA